MDRLLPARIANSRDGHARLYLPSALAHYIFGSLGYPQLITQALIAPATGADPESARSDLAAALSLAQDSADSGLLAQVLMARSELEAQPTGLLTEALEHAQTAGDRGLEARAAIALASATLDGGSAEIQQLNSLLGAAQTWQPEYHGTLFLESRIAEHEGRQVQAVALMQRAKAAAGECWGNQQQLRLERLQAALAGR